MNASHSNPFSLAGETALVTGGGTGIGLAIARSLIAAGAHVVLAGRRKAVLAAAARELGPSASAATFDVDKLEAAPAFVNRLTRRVGPIGILVNNAGIHLKKAAVETSPAEFAAVITTHVFGSHALTRALAPGMIRRGSGSIIFIASMASLFGIPKVVAYSAAKSAFVGMARTLATELSPHGVRVNAVAPGWIETDMSRNALAGDPKRLEKILGRTPMGRLGQAEDVGRAVVFLASPAAAFITGIVLPVDGGASIGF